MTVTVNVTMPEAFVVTVFELTKVWPSPNPLGSAAVLAKNSMWNLLLTMLLSDPLMTMPALGFLDAGDNRIILKIVRPGVGIFVVVGQRLAGFQAEIDAEARVGKDRILRDCISGGGVAHDVNAVAVLAAGPVKGDEVMRDDVLRADVEQDAVAFVPEPPLLQGRRRSSCLESDCFAL